MSNLSREIEITKRKLSQIKGSSLTIEEQELERQYLERKLSQLEEIKTNYA